MSRLAARIVVLLAAVLAAGVGSGPAVARAEAALYPGIRTTAAIPPTFGLTTRGKPRALPANQKRVSSFPLAERGTLTHLAAWLDGRGSGRGAHQRVRLVIYADSRGAPTVLLAKTTTHAVTHGAPGRWIVLPLTTALDLEPGRYHLGIHSGRNARIARYGVVRMRGSTRRNRNAFGSPTRVFGTAAETRRTKVAVHGKFKFKEQDVEAPSVPQGMAFAGVTQTSVGLVWDASVDNVDVVGYRLYRDHKLVHSTTQLAYVFTGLACSTSYTFGLEAYDAAGNVSNRAEAAGTTSTAPCDGSPPAPPAPPPAPPLPPPPPPGEEAPPTRYLAPTGSDAGTCTKAEPCATFQRAYAVSAPGETVEVAGGTYPNQNIRAAADKGAPNIVFRPASGARVIVGGMSFGGGGDPNLGPRNITIRGMEMAYKGTAPAAGNQRSIYVGPGSRYIRLEYMDAGSVDSWKADYLTVIGGDYGPCNAVAFASNVCGNNKQDVSTNVLIDGATFHDMRFDESCFQSGADCHWECMYLNGGANITVRNSRFYQCTLYNIFVTISGPDARTTGHKNLVIENNWFATPWTESAGGSGSPSRGSGISLAWCKNSPQGYQNVWIRFNSFAPNTGFWPDTDTAVCTWSNVNFVGNLAQFAGTCDSRSNYAYNVWTTTYRTGTCSATDRSIGSSLPYVMNATDGTADYHLTGAATVIDDFVPTTVPGGCPAADRDGEARPAGPRCDAGSDERP